MIARPRAYLRRTLPPRWVEAYRVGRRVVQGLPTWPPPNLYEQLYQTHALASSDTDAVGCGPWDNIGKAELVVLQAEGDTFTLGEATVDMLCAFSVFTHMEHEDTFRYLRGARRLVRPGGRLVFSCLAMDTALARNVFLESSSIDIQSRWATPRSITTTRETMKELAQLAGWSLVGWYHGDEANVTLPEGGPPLAFGQSIGVLQ